MRVLAFRHGPFEYLGRIADALQAHGLAYEYVDLYHPNAPEPRTSDADALVILGGSMSVNDDLTYLRREMAYIQEAVENGTPVLGVCLGSQLVAKALGAEVSPNRVKEIGWAPVTFNDVARQDRLFAGISEPAMIFHWHGETFGLPDGAELLASSSNCRNQAFRWGDRVYGLQFHLEVTPAIVVHWCAEDEECGDRRELREPIDAQAYAASAEELARVVFGRWCAMVLEKSGRRAP